MTTLLARAFAGLYTQALARPVVHKGELLSVQRLRGLAVLMVLVVHVEDAARFLQGWSGEHSAYALHLGYAAPDLFFVISGFVMAYITFLRPFDPRSWAISRLVRIYPMYVLFTAMAVALWLYDPRITMGTGEQNWSRVLLSLAGLPQADLPLLFVGWTIEHEIVFYVVVFLTAWKLGRERLPAVMCTLSALALLRWAVERATGAEIWDWHFTSLYILQFTMGVLVHHFWQRLKPLGWKLPLAFGLVMLTLAMAFAHSGTINEETLSRVVLFGLAYSGFLLAGLNHEIGRQARGLHPQRRDALVWVGDASYSLYLSHPFVLGAFGKLFPHVGSGLATQLGAVLLATVLTLAVGLLTHVLLERQVMEFGRWAARRRAPAAQGAST